MMERASSGISQPAGGLVGSSLPAPAALSGHLASLLDDVVLQAALIETFEQEAVIVDLAPVRKEGVLAGGGGFVAVG